MSEQRAWTMMVYMAGDNGKILAGEQIFDPMEQAGLDDLREMEQAGATKQVAVVAQFDSLAQTAESYRVVIQPRGGVRQMERIVEMNTGDPSALIDFVVWSMAAFPAAHYALVLWNHGTGWKDDDLYAFAKRHKLRLAASIDEVRGATKRRRRSARGGHPRLSSGLFLSSAAAIAALKDSQSRGICYDDSSMDFLDNSELEGALRDVTSRTGRKIDLLGMDACLMSMLEVGYQLREQANYLVASQEAAPMVGWPYGPILQELGRNPEIEPGLLARRIVEEYGRSFGDEPRGWDSPIAQSALDLSRMDDLAGAMTRLSRALRGSLSGGDLFLVDALRRARNSVVRFEDDDYADLHDFLSLLRQRYAGEDAVLKEAIDEVITMLAPNRARSVIMANVVTGPSPFERATGLSIYLPQSGYSPYYDRLACATLGWGEFLCELNEVPAERRRIL
ncbi:MAG TPA: clostripain-related cysteine peptidase [Herpetosiphonaceae bacterium]|nr:clostripain-related cysteine peptidase [Herpetosiphonaceae bacterium]